jgi:pimeloyl-ACP methyl ester carboxylesterase
MGAVATSDDAARLYFSEGGYRAMMRCYDDELEGVRADTGCEALTVQTRFGATHVIAAGPLGAPVVVLLHGTNANCLGWAGLMSVLKDRFRVYAPDVPGQAGRSAPTRLPFTGSAYADWLDDMLTALGAVSPSLVGISGGGHISLKYASYYPARAERIVALSSAGFVRPRFPMSMNNDVVMGLTHRLLRSRVKTPEDAVAFFTRMAPSPPGSVPFGSQPGSSESIFLLLTEFKSLGAPTPLTDEELARITTPVLLLMGKYEAIMKPEKVIERARQTVRTLVDARILPEVGHGMIGERPDVVYPIVEEFLLDGRPG